MPIECLCTLESLSPLSFSRHYEVPKLQKESPGDYDERTWRERLHCDAEGMVQIPPMAPKLCVDNAAQRMALRIPGKGTSTYTKNFRSGVLVLDPIPLGIHRDAVARERLFVPADGKRGGAKRVMRIFPMIPEWRADVLFHVLDQTITEEVFIDVLREAGNFIGLGRFRPQNGGFYGRFTLVNHLWQVGEMRTAA